RGFTLIELLVVVAIIAILASIAIPRFFYYKERSNRGSMIADARNAATTFEAYFVDFGTYGPAETRNAITGPGFDDWPDADYRVKASRGNTLTAAIVADTTYSITVSNNRAGPGKSPLTLNSTGNCSFADSSPC
ncbi:MAG: type IV pilin protein, partial [Thermodesulfobacteriota bacterium]